MPVEVSAAHLITLLIFFIGLNVGATKLVLGKYIKKIEDQEVRIRELEKDTLVENEVATSFANLDSKISQIRKDVRSIRSETERALIN